MFVVMLYTATGRKSWIIIGLIAFAAGAVLAAGMFSHVGQRVDAWLHPFSNEQYNKTPAAPRSWSPAFSARHQAACSAPARPRPSFARYVCELDFIYASLGEESGLMGVPPF